MNLSLTFCHSAASLFTSPRLLLLRSLHPSPSSHLPAARPSSTDPHLSGWNCSRNLCLDVSSLLPTPAPSPISPLSHQFCVCCNVFLFDHLRSLCNKVFSLQIVASLAPLTTVLENLPCSSVSLLLTTCRQKKKRKKIDNPGARVG